MRRLSQILSLFLIVTLLTFIGCEGPSGSEGPQGPEGPEGPEGPVGPAGENGSMIYSGEGEPDTDIGNKGDYYLNTNTGEMFGPKDEDGWGNPIIVLMGEDGTDGQDGEDGSQIHSGSGAPDSDTGDIGDFYFDKSCREFYGPKTEDGWGTPTDLTGEDGQDGEDGSQIHSGSGAPGSDIGDTGDFYFDESSGELYGPKAESGWGSPTDLTGEDGEDGQDGEDGSQIHSGSGSPDSGLGMVGDYYLDEPNYDLYGPKTSSGWGTPLNLKGADGNANVTRYIFPGHDFSATADTTLRIESVNSVTEKRQSTWLVYLVNFQSSYWAIPGNGKDGNTYYNLYHRFAPEYTNTYLGITVPSAASFEISTENDVSGEQYDEIEVVRIEASNTEDHTKRAGEAAIIPEDLDVSDYEAVAEYYGFHRE